MKNSNIRVDKLLSSLGYGTRKDVAGMVKQGLVVFDGHPISDAAQKIPDASDLRDRLMIRDEQLDPRHGMVLMMNKPLGMSCSHQEAGAVIYDLLPQRWRQRSPVLSTVGRLDKETSGLLLITDDGAFIHSIISPKRHVKKTYLVDVVKPLTPNDVVLFGAGTLKLRGEEKPLASAELEIITPQRALITITEGRYHQVRRMFAAIGNHVTHLHRTKIGNLSLPNDLALGKWMLLTQHHIEFIFD
jgi:16S rRNA pseudouridine516 synthase